MSYLERRAAHNLKWSEVRNHYDLGATDPMLVAWTVGLPTAEVEGYFTKRDELKG